MSILLFLFLVCISFNSGKFNHLLLFSDICLYSIVNSLECYVCEQQEGNNDKCIKTVRMCQRHEDTCATLILWTTPHEW